DHLLLGAVVEHAAPGRIGEPYPRAQHGRDHAHRDAAHGARLLGVLDRGGAAARALHHPGARMSHGFFLWGAYSVTVVALALEVIFRFRRSRRGGPPRQIK